VDAAIHQRTDQLMSMTPIAGRLTGVILGCGLVLGSAGPAHAAEWDVDNLPTVDAQTLAYTIGTFTLDHSVSAWTLDYAIQDLATTTHASGETVVTLNADILFDFAKAVVPPTAGARIAAAVAKAPKGSAVSIGGHTDDVGTPANNLTLSQARAQAVAAAVKRARPDLVLAVKGFGEGSPVAANGNDSGRSQNRRVEIRFAG
jgi:outer membrane protein OmpA-like peptidoglycan-associated protein